MTPVEPLPPELAKDAARRWAKFCSALADAGLALPENRRLRRATEQVMGFSNFVARSCTRDPGMLVELMVSGDLQRTYAAGEYGDRLALGVGGLTDDSGLRPVLAGVRCREMVRIAWRDLSGAADLKETLSDLSRLAEACVDQAVSVLYQRQCRQAGTPYGRDGRQQLVVIGMGKLGGGELNFSSDVDLVFAYPDAGHTRGGPGPLTSEAFFLQLCRSFMALMRPSGTAAPLFRIDARLRPYGDGGPLVLSFDQMEQYYQRQGREWERYAWIKARVVAGDKAAGGRLLEKLKPFVFRRYLDFGAFDSLRDLKDRINLQVRRKGLAGNIKTGWGGIREVEFFGQMFQLIRGGLVPALQAPGILQVLRTLYLKKLVPRRVCEELAKGYVFLRNTENRLQAIDDRQTHLLPVSPLEKLRLAVSMGFDSWPAFERQLNRHRTAIHGHFNDLLNTGRGPAAGTDAIEKELQGVWLQLLNAEPARQVLQVAGLAEPDAILRLLDDFRAHPNTRALSKNGRERLDRLVPKILNGAARVKHPAIVCRRIFDLLGAIERRTCYLALLLESRVALSHLLKLVSASPWIASFLARHPAVLDELIDPRILYRPPDRKDLGLHLDRRVKGLGIGDLEAQMELLRNFKQVNVLRVAAADVTDALPLMRVSDQLTWIAETIVSRVLDFSWEYLVQKHGTPTCRLDGSDCPGGFAVIGYGKLGGIELGYGSDLDLVFLHAGSAGRTTGSSHPIENAQFFARLGQRVIHFLTVLTPSGTLYETDMRLRPSGSSGLLVSHIDAFREYQLHKAWTWEHQALVRARVICGNPRLAKSFEQIRRQVIRLPRGKSDLKAAVNTMRERMRRQHEPAPAGMFDLKQGAGGMVDIEFLIQFLVLRHANQYPSLTTWTDNVRLLKTLAQQALVPRDTAAFLGETYLAYRKAVHRLSLQQASPVVAAERFAARREKTVSVWRRYLGPGATPPK